MKEYVILLATDASWLTSQVNGLIAGGWQPQGGVTLAPACNEDTGEHTHQWAQAMTKEEDVDSARMTKSAELHPPAQRATPRQRAHIPLHVAGSCCRR